ncbi:serine hydrolase domain-containing protein [Microbacterium aureliae]
MPFRPTTWSSATRSTAAVVTAAALVLGLSACSNDVSVSIDVPAQVEGDFPEETLTPLREAVDRAVVASGASGAIVGVWAPWSGSWVSGVGTTTPGGDEVTADMQFRAGKITRAMTCDVVYELAKEGVLDVDDDVATHVPGVADLTDVTLEMLCDNTSGIGSYSERLLRMWLDNPERKWVPLELATYGLGQERTAEPGARYTDSDAGYLLLGLALENASGERMSALLREYVTDPLDLEGTYLAATPTEAPRLSGLRSPRVEGTWDCAEPADVSNVSLTTAFTDGGVMTTITDLGRYTQALATGTLTGTSRFDDGKPPSPTSSSWYTYAGGAFRAGSMVGQTGSVPGYLTSAYADPDTGLTVAVVLNNSSAHPNFAGWLAFELAAIASKAPAASGQEAPSAGLPWTPEQFSKTIDKNAVCSAPTE